MPTAVLERGSRKVDRKVLSISSKRQITIPQKFYQTLGFGNEAECIVHGNELIIRPVKTVSGGEFAELRKSPAKPRLCPESQNFQFATDGKYHRLCTAARL